MNNILLNNYIQYVTRSGIVKAKSVIFLDNGITTTFDVKEINEDFFIFAVFQNNLRRYGIGFENFDNVNMLGFINSDIVDLSCIPTNSFLVSEQNVTMSYDNQYVKDFLNPKPEPLVLDFPVVQIVSVNNFPVVNDVNVTNFPNEQNVKITNQKKNVPVYFNPTFILDSMGVMGISAPTLYNGYVNDIIQNVVDCHSGNYIDTAMQWYDTVNFDNGVGYQILSGSSKSDVICFTRGGLYFKVSENIALSSSSYVKLRIYQNVITNEVWFRINQPNISSVLRQFNYDSMVLTVNGFIVTDSVTGLKLEVSKNFI